ncbi:MAG: S8 family peptidase [Armatimonadota bacterium]
MAEQDSSRRDHLWIPDEEVIKVGNKPTGRDKPRNVIPSEHGGKLSTGLQSIVDYIEHSKASDTLSDEDVIIFKVTLPEGEKLDNSQRMKILADNGINVNVVKDNRKAIVSTNKQRFQRLRNRVEDYKDRGRFKDFQFLDSFEPYMGSEKQAGKLRELALNISPPRTVDIQLLLVPGLGRGVYDRILPKLETRISEAHGEVVEKPYFLSDGTPVIRTVIPSVVLQGLSEDEAIYRVEETRFFSCEAGADRDSAQNAVSLDVDVNVEELPIVAVLDSGIILPKGFESLVIDHWSPAGCNGGDSVHGTKVASKTIFSNLGEQIRAGVMKPRARVVDCNILDGRVPENTLISRIQDAVSRYKDIVQIYNLSANAPAPIEGDEISIIGYELDNLMRLHGIQFVFSAGNHYLWKTCDSLEDVIDDDDSRIAAPADSMLGVTVGAVVACEHQGSISGKNYIAPYSRMGPGFAGFRKPDVSAYGATVLLEGNDGTVPEDDHSLLLHPGGTFVYDAGTSFTAPVVAGDLAEVTAITPYSDILLAKALLLHGTLPVWDEDQVADEDAEYIANLYGRGVTDPDLSMYSSPSRVTFLRTGDLNRLTKERVKFYMPTVLAAAPGRNVAKVTVTCVSRPPIDRTKGTEYLGAFVSASLHKVSGNGTGQPCANPPIKEGRRKWDTCFHFSRMFTTFEAGDWQIWLELRTRWEIENDIQVPYALAVTIEDLTRSLDIYSQIELETQGRFRPINTMRIPVTL